MRAVGKIFSSLDQERAEAESGCLIPTLNAEVDFKYDVAVRYNAKLDGAILMV